jgi:hypothetical protein
MGLLAEYTRLGALPAHELETAMVSTLRLYIDASYAITVMALVGIISGFATAAMTSNTERSLQAGLVMFALTGALLTIRLWRVTRKTKIPANATPPKVQDHS